VGVLLAEPKRRPRTGQEERGETLRLVCVQNEMEILQAEDVVVRFLVLEEGEITTWCSQRIQSQSFGFLAVFQLEEKDFD
jgi:hypothetical protein